MSSVPPRSEQHQQQQPTARPGRQRPIYVVEHMEEDDPEAPSVFPAWALLEYRHMLSLVGSGGEVWFTSLSHASIASLRNELERDAGVVVDVVPEADATTSRTSETSSSVHPTDRVAGGVGKGRATPRLFTQSITTLLEQRKVPRRDVCLLDPKSPFPLSVTDAGLFDAPTPTMSPPARSTDAAVAATSPESTSTAPASVERGGPFTHFLFGGILGDDPPRDRTASLRNLGGFGSRHLGSVQMTTDTALGVTCRVVERGMALALPKPPTSAPTTTTAAAAAEASQRDAEVEQRGPHGGRLKWVTEPELRFGRGESVVMPFRYLAEDQASSDEDDGGDQDEDAAAGASADSKVLAAAAAAAAAGTAASPQPPPPSSRSREAKPRRRGKRSVRTPLMPPGMREHIRSDLDRAFEF